MKKWRWSALVLILLASRASSQDVAPRIFVQGIPVFAPPQTSTLDPSFFNAEFTAGSQNDPLAGNHNFPTFIGFISNPVQSVDPRAMTTIFPIFGAYWTSADPPIPSARVLAFGPGITVALGERFCFGLDD